ncbi:MAG: hypothetical protein HXX09_05355 [Bacteroidetes bacterium]|nr:hypothetical protein [Bacteroidota bacterium]
MNSVGGYFELELRKGKEYHPNAIALNTGRNALELILKVKKYKKVYIPYYTCYVILEPFEKTKISYEFYSIDKNFEPIFDYNLLNSEDGFLYTNYFGLKDRFIEELANECSNLIIDNSQAFFSAPINNIPTFYSCRKFFGVPDGAYLYLDNIIEFDFPIDNSEDRFSHLLKRIDLGAEEGYKTYKENENNLVGQPIKQMSILTRALLRNIDYKKVIKIRKENFLYYQQNLSLVNDFNIIMDKETVPMNYPFFSKKNKLKQLLINNKIFIPTYWPNVISWSDKNSLEYIFSTKMIFLPIDQRYDNDNISKIVKIIKSNNHEH